jgi:hypothetical protein
LLIEKCYGRGRVLLMGSGAEARCSSLQGMGEAEAFLTLVLESVKKLSGAGELTELRAGSSATLTLNDPPGDRVVQWQRPGNGTPQILSADLFPPEATQTTLRLPEITPWGLHRLTWRGKQVEFTNLRFLAVNADASESDPRRFDFEQAKLALLPWRAEIFSSLDASGVLRGDARAQREFPVVLLLLVLGVVVAESFLSNRLYCKAKDGSAQPASSEGHAKT